MQEDKLQRTARQVQRTGSQLQQQGSRLLDVPMRASGELARTTSRQNGAVPNRCIC